MTRYCHQLASFVCTAAVVGGCVAPQDDGVSLSRQRAQAVLTAARASRINMFGDLPNTRDATYFNRPAVSAKQHTFADVGGDFDPAIDATGRRMVFASTRHSIHPDLYIKAVDGVAVTQLTADPASDIQPALSPDGTRVAFASDRSGNWDVWIIGVGGDQPVQLTSGMGDELHPSWSPDGTRIVFCSLPSEGGQWELWIADAVAGGTKRFIGYGLFPQWSPVSDTIVFQRARERGSRWFSIWTLTLVDGEPRYPTELAASPMHAMILPTWSPDGRRIAFTSVGTEFLEHRGNASPLTAGASDIWLMYADGRGKARLTDGYTTNFAPTFSTSGRIFFSSSRSGHECVWSVLPAGSVPGKPAGDFLTHTPARLDTEVHRPARTTSAREGP